MNQYPQPLKAYLDGVARRYECEDFIASDPVSVPHGFDEASDRELVGLFSALLAWGRRDILLAKLADLCDRMRYRPTDFIFNFDVDRDASRLAGFVHRTFNESDAVWLCLALRKVLRSSGSIERLSASFISPGDVTIENAIQGLSETLLSIVPEMPVRMRKHLARPSTGSACKRLSLYFRWMIRPGPVDLGIWTSILPRQLVVPLDVHSGRQARRIGLLERKSNDWRAVLELTRACRAMNPADPSRYDFALFGTGAAGEFLDESFCRDTGDG